MRTYMDPDSGEFVGEFETRGADGEVSRQSEWFATQAEAEHFSKTGELKKTPENKSQVAQTTKDQIGFWAFAEVGARNFQYDATSLYFDCKPTTRIVKVKVTLDPSDTYSVRVTKKDGTELYSESDIYNSMLAELIRNLQYRLAPKKGA